MTLIICIENYLMNILILIEFKSVKGGVFIAKRYNVQLKIYLLNFSDIESKSSYLTRTLLIVNDLVG